MEPRIDSKFWMIHVLGNRAPIYRHPTLEHAKTEAVRLAQSNQGQVIILEAVESVEIEKFTPPMKWQKLVKLAEPKEIK